MQYHQVSSGTILQVQERQQHGHRHHGEHIVERRVIDRAIGQRPIGALRMDDQEQYRCSARCADSRGDRRLQHRHLQRDQHQKNQAERQRDLCDAAREQPAVTAQPLQVQPGAELEQDEPQRDVEQQTRIVEHLRIQQAERARSNEQTRNDVAADPR